MDSAACTGQKEPGSRAIKSFVLRSARMSPAQKRSYEAFFSLYAIKGDEAGIIDCPSVFGNNNPLSIEIGFGMGRATAGIAYKNPGINYLGIEVHKPGIGRLLWEIEKLGLKNIRIIEGDAAEILTKRIPSNSVSAFHIFFFFFWPKKRHHKRRLVKRPFTDLLAAKLISESYIYMVSDWIDYGEWALAELSATPALLNKYSAFSEPQEWRPETEFEKKGRIKNHEIRELFFIKT
jgi:tRNA (guanine-N7-)-methyltransferase